MAPPLSDRNSPDSLVNRALRLSGKFAKFDDFHAAYKRASYLPIF
jgi:hypothetical protein